MLLPLGTSGAHSSMRPAHRQQELFRPSSVVIHRNLLRPEILAPGCTSGLSSERDFIDKNRVQMEIAPAKDCEERERRSNATISPATGL